MSEEPTTGELSRRINDLSTRTDKGFNGINQRLDGLPSEKTLLALLEGRDAANAVEFRGIRDDVKDMGERITKVEGDARAEVAKLEDRLSKNRTAMIAAVGVLTSSVLGLLAIIYSQLGGAA